jgi:hypothetical protein
MEDRQTPDAMHALDSGTVPEALRHQKEAPVPIRRASQS